MKTSLKLLSLGAALVAAIGVMGTHEAPRAVVPTDPKYLQPSWERADAAPDTSMQTADDTVAMCLVYVSIQGTQAGMEQVLRRAQYPVPTKRSALGFHELLKDKIDVGDTGEYMELLSLYKAQCQKLGVVN